MKKADDIKSIYNRYVEDLHTYALYLGLRRDCYGCYSDVFCNLQLMSITMDVSNIKFYLFKSLKTGIRHPQIKRST